MLCKAKEWRRDAPSSGRLACRIVGSSEDDCPSEVAVSDELYLRTSSVAEWTSFAWRSGIESRNVDCDWDDDALLRRWE